MPWINFGFGNPRLDVLAAQILWRENESAWHKFAVLYGIDPGLTEWDECDVSSCILAAYECTEPSSHEILRATFSGWWANFSERWFTLMARFFEFDRFAADAEFKAWIGISNIFPRDIETFEFLVPKTASKELLVRLCAHETCHFYFYEKVFELFPEQRMSLLQSRKVWLISEMLVPLIFATQPSCSILGEQPYSTYACSQIQLDRVRMPVELRMNGRLHFEQLLSEIEDSLLE